MSAVPALALRPLTAMALDEGGYRLCVRVDCNNRFRPWSRTAYHCSDECATKSFYERRGLALPQTVVAAAAQRAAVKQERRERMQALRAKLQAEGRLPTGGKPRPPRRGHPEKERGRPSREPWEGAIPQGKQAVYQGGSKAAWLKPGTLVLIRGYYEFSPTQRRYAIECEGKRTVVSAPFVTISTKGGKKS